jgi:hydroxymethylpyrimidine pyrophosphatase-like HAD family hydrolase
LNLPDFNNHPKAVAVDLDGTLLNSQTRLSDRTKKALLQCLLGGIPVIVATSRPARIFNRIFPQELAAGCSQVIMNGAIAIGKPPLSGYFKEIIPENIAGLIVEVALRNFPETRITLELDGYEFGANWSTNPNTLWARNSATPDMILPVKEALFSQPCKIALGGIGNDIMKLTNIIKSAFGDTLKVVPALLGNPLLNITTSLASKPAALRKLLSPKGISLQDVVAFGDDIPDLEMLIECGISIAMANAFSEVKSVCN